MSRRQRETNSHNPALLASGTPSDLTKPCLSLLWGRGGLLDGKSINHVRSREFLDMGQHGKECTLSWGTVPSCHFCLFLPSPAARGSPWWQTKGKMGVSIWPIMHYSSVLTGSLNSPNQQTAIFCAKNLDIQTSILTSLSNVHPHLSHRILYYHSCRDYKQ